MEYILIAIAVVIFIAGLNIRKDRDAYVIGFLAGGICFCLSALAWMGA